MSTDTTTTSTPPEGWRLAPPGRSIAMADINAVTRLIAQLVGLGVKLPDEVTRLTTTWAAVQDLRTPEPEPVVGLRADAQQLASLATAAAQRRAVLAELPAVIDRVDRELVSDVTSWFQANADDVIAQMRPGFAVAAAAVRAAVDAGVTSTMGLRDAPDDAVTLWRAAYGRGAASDQLSAIASARYAMSESCWIAPMETGYSNAGDFSVCFNAPAGWWTRRRRSWEDAADPQLLSVGDAAALRWERRAPVYADTKAEAHHRRLNDADQAAPADLTMANLAGRFRG